MRILGGIREKMRLIFCSKPEKIIAIDLDKFNSLFLPKKDVTGFPRNIRIIVPNQLGKV